MIEATRRQRQQLAKVQCEIWLQNIPVVEYFFELGTQWLVAGVDMGSRRIGLNYATVAAMMRDVWLIPESERRALLANLRLMELAALKVWNNNN